MLSWVILRLSPSKEPPSSIINLLVYILPFATPFSNIDIVSQVASPSKAPFITSLLALIVPEENPLEPTVTVELDLISPVNLPKILNSVSISISPLIIVPSAMIVV